LALIAGLEAMDLKMFVPEPKDRLVTVTAVNIPAGVNDEKFRTQLLDEFNIEIAGGIGPTKGQIWRIGTMGWCSQKQFVLQLLAAIDKALLDQGHRHSPGAGVGGAIHSYTHTEKPVAAAR
jgi:aspartate aminotransferase-like enzyme